MRSLGGILAATALIWLGGCPEMALPPDDDAGPPADDDVLADDDVDLDDDDATPGDDDTADDDVTGDDDTTPGDDDTTGGDDDTGDDDDTAADDDTGDDDDTAEAPACDRIVPDEYDTIQGAIDAAFDGETICVRAGTYPENISFMGKAVHVWGIDGAPVTFIDGGAAGSVVRFCAGETAASVLDSFTLRGGLADEGGGVYVEAAAPTLVDLVIEGNTALVDGGGLFADHGDVLLERVTFRDNGAVDDGGAIYVEGGAPTLVHVDLLDNTAGEKGGGISARQAAYDHRGGTIAGNLAGGDGGGIHLYQAQPTLRHVELIANDAGDEGGGMFALDSAPQLEHVAVLANGAVGDGGGVCASSSQPALAHVVVMGNVSGDDGGGIDADGTVMSLRDSVVAGNTAATAGGLDCDGCAITAVHTVLWDNVPDDVYGMASPVGADGNRSVDPAFLDIAAADPRAWDLHLATGSALIDGGDAAGADPDGGPADVGIHGGAGADGWDRDRDGAPAWWQPGPYDAVHYPAEGLDCDDRDPAIRPLAGC